MGQRCLQRNEITPLEYFYRLERFQFLTEMYSVSTLGLHCLLLSQLIHNGLQLSPSSVSGTNEEKPNSVLRKPSSDSELYRPEAWTQAPMCTQLQASSAANGLTPASSNVLERVACHQAEAQAAPKHGIPKQRDTKRHMRLFGN